MKRKHPDFTVGITTCYGKAQIIQTIKSLRKSKGVGKFPLIVVADRVPIEPSVKKDLKKLDVLLIENPYPASALSKQKQILKLVNTKYVLLTQDDVLFKENALKKILQEFKQNPKVTFIGLKNTPLEPDNLIEAGINVGTNLANGIARIWNNGDNYLAMLGRLMAFRTDWIIRKLDIETNVVSSDAYLYFENKKAGGVYKCIWDTCLYFRNPQNLKEHLKKSSRFQNSEYEMLSFGKFTGLSKKYKVPLKIMLQVSFGEFLKNPLDFAIYLFIYFYTRLNKINASKSLITNWDVDLSTKLIN